MAYAERLITDAEAQGRPIVVLETASAAKGRTVKIEAPSDARNSLAIVQPQPFPPDRKASLAALTAALQGATGDPSVVWLADGIDHASDAGAFAEGLAALAKGGTFAVLAGTPGREPLGLSAEVGDRRQTRQRAWSAPAARRARAPFTPSPPRANGWAKPPSSLQPARPRPISCSICRWSCAIR